MLIVSQRIAVVDDDHSILRALRRLLGAAGFTVNTFGSGEELLAWEGLGTIECLILDVHLAGLSGFDVQERLTDRSEEHTSELQSHSDLVCRLLLEKKKT